METTKKEILENPDRAESPAKAERVALENIRQAIRSIRYGVVQIIIQDGKVIQIDRTEKTRLV
ncbi:MAG TPA: YezD family protein [Capsulimonadaceae bacterium]|jgi:hypothetical protein